MIQDLHEGSKTVKLGEITILICLGGGVHYSSVINWNNIKASLVTAPTCTSCTCSNNRFYPPWSKTLTIHYQTCPGFCSHKTEKSCNSLESRRKSILWGKSFVVLQLFLGLKNFKCWPVIFFVHVFPSTSYTKPGTVWICNTHPQNEGEIKKCHLISLKLQTFFPKPPVIALWL